MAFVTSEYSIKHLFWLERWPRTEKQAEFGQTKTNFVGLKLTSECCLCMCASTMGEWELSFFNIIVIVKKSSEFFLLPFTNCIFLFLFYQLLFQDYWQSVNLFSSAAADEPIWFIVIHLAPSIYQIWDIRVCNSYLKMFQSFVQET